jgi:hypothetical protein
MSLRKPLWPWIECPIVRLSDFGGKTLLSITKPLLCHLSQAAAANTSAHRHCREIKDFHGKYAHFIT